MKNKINNVIKTTILFILIFMMIFGDGQIDGILNNSIDAHAEDTSAETAQNTQTDAQKPVPPTIEKIPEGGNGSATQSTQSSSTSVNTSRSTSPAVTSTNGTTEEKKTETADKTETETETKNVFKVSFSCVPEDAVKFDGETAIAADSDYTFTLTPSDGMSIEKVTANGSELKPSSSDDTTCKNTYTVTKVQSDLQIDVTAADSQDKSVTLTAQADGKYNVTVSGTKKALGRAVSMKASVMTENEIDSALAGTDKKASDLDVQIAFDITLYDKDGAEVEPDGQVSLSFEDIVGGTVPEQKADDLQVLHVSDDSTVDTLTPDISGKDITLSTDSFSAYIILYAPSSTASTCTVTGYVDWTGLNTTDFNWWTSFIQNNYITAGNQLAPVIKVGTENALKGNMDVDWQDTDTDRWKYTVEKVPYNSGDNVAVIFAAVSSVPFVFNKDTTVSAAVSSVSDGTLTVPDIKPVLTYQTVTVSQTLIPSNDSTSSGTYDISVSGTEGGTYIKVKTLTVTGTGAAASVDLPQGAYYKVTPTAPGGYAALGTPTGTSGKVGDSTVTAAYSWVKQLKPTVSLTWSDNNNFDGSRPTDTSAVSFPIYLKSGESYTQLTSSNCADYGINAASLTPKVTASGAVWTYAFGSLPSADSSGNAYTYYVKENLGTDTANVADNYVVPSDYVQMDTDGNFAAVNTQKGTFTGYILWKDAAVTSGRPVITEGKSEAVKIHLYRIATGETQASEITDFTATFSAVSGTSNEWRVYMKNLAQYDANGKPYVYYITEDNVSGYAAAAYDNGTGTYGNQTTQCYDSGTIINRVSAKTTFDAKKYWKKGAGGNKSLTSSELSGYVMLWRYTDIDGHTWKEGSPATRITVNNDGTTTETLIEKPLSDIEAETQDTTDGSYDISFADLDQYDIDGNKYVYFAQEIINGGTDEKIYTPEYDNKSNQDTADDSIVDVAMNGGQINNVKSQLTDITVSKEWLANAKQAYISSLTSEFQLIRKTNDPSYSGDYQPVSGETLTITAFNASDMKKYGTFTDLPRYDDNGYEYMYSLKESVTSSNTGVTITNGTGVADGESYKMSGGDLDGNYKFEVSSPYKVTTAESEQSSLSRVASSIETTNTLSDTLDYTIMKKWSDGDSAHSGYTIGITLYKTGYEKQQDGTVVMKTSTVQEYDMTETDKISDREWEAARENLTSGTGKCTKAGLSMYDALGYPYAYYVEETNKPAGYYRVLSYANGTNGKDIIATVSNNKTGGGTYITFMAAKTWKDGGNVAERKPITVKIAQYNKETGVVTPYSDLSMTLNATNGWREEKSFSVTTHILAENCEYYVYEDSIGDAKVTYGTPQYAPYTDSNGTYYKITADGTYGLSTAALQYKVRNEFDSKYQQLNVTNTRCGNFTYTVTKKWMDGKIGDDSRPYMDIQLLKTDSNGSSAAVTDASGNAYKYDTSKPSTDDYIKESTDTDGNTVVSFKNIPRYDENGSLLTYKVDETLSDRTDESGNIVNKVRASSYVSEQEGYLYDTENAVASVTMTNTAVGTEEPVFYKSWVDNGNADLTRSDIYLTLYRKITSGGTTYSQELNNPYIDREWTKGTGTVVGNINTYDWKCTFDTLPEYVSESMIGTTIGGYTVTADDVGTVITYYVKENINVPGDYKTEYHNGTVTTNVSGGTETKTTEFAGTANGGGEVAENGLIVNRLDTYMTLNGKKLWENIPNLLSKDAVMPGTVTETYSGTSTSYTRVKDISFTLWQRIGAAADGGSWTQVKVTTGNEYSADGSTNAITLGDINGTAQVPVLAYLLKDNSGNYTYSFVDKSGQPLHFPKYDTVTGKTIYYQVKEIFDNDESGSTALAQAYMNVYPSEYTVTKDFSLTNSYSLADNVKKITVNKTWGNLASYGASNGPATTFDLYQFAPGTDITGTINFSSGAKYKTVTLASGASSVDFTDIPVYAPNAKLYVYAVVEEYVNGYFVVHGANGTSLTASAGNSITKSQVGDGYGYPVAVSTSASDGNVAFSNIYDGLDNGNFITLKGAKKWNDYYTGTRPNTNVDNGITVTVTQKYGSVTNTYTNSTSNGHIPDFDVVWTDNGDSTWNYVLCDHGSTTAMKHWGLYAPDGTAYIYQVTDSYTSANGAYAATPTSAVKATTYDITDKTDHKLTLTGLTNTFGTSVSWKKYWNDDSNSLGVRPANITVTLQYSTDGSNWNDITSLTAFGSDNTIKGFAGYIYNKPWSGTGNNYSDKVTFNYLPTAIDGKAITYRVQETGIGGATAQRTLTDGNPAIGAYEITKSGTGTTSDPYVFRNTLIKTSFTITKNWTDDSDKYEVRPTSLTLYLMRSTSTTSGDTIDTASGEYVKTTSGDYITTTLKGTGDSWNTTVANLPANAPTGDKYYYYATEYKPDSSGKVSAESTVTNPSYWLKTAVYSSTAGTELTNKLGPDTETGNDFRSFTVKKIWDDNSNQDGGRPAVTVKLQYSTDGTTWKDYSESDAAKIAAVQSTVTADTASNKWSHSWAKLPVYFSDGKKLYYRAIETGTSDTAGGTGTISGTNGNLKIPYNVSYAYYDTEGGTASALGTDTSVETVTNTHVPVTVSVNAVKTWPAFPAAGSGVSGSTINSDAAAKAYRAELRPNNIYIKLLTKKTSEADTAWNDYSTDTSVEIKTISGSADTGTNSWSLANAWTGLPAFIAGDAYEYKVVECDASGKTSSDTGNAVPVSYSSAVTSGTVTYSTTGGNTETGVKTDTVANSYAYKTQCSWTKNWGGDVYGMYKQVKSITLGLWYKDAGDSTWKDTGIRKAVDTTSNALSYSGSFTELPAFDENGTALEYHVEEESYQTTSGKTVTVDKTNKTVGCYTVTCTDTNTLNTGSPAYYDTNKTDITNTLVTRTDALNIHKNWNMTASQQENAVLELKCGTAAASQAALPSDALITVSKGTSTMTVGGTADTSHISGSSWTAAVTGLPLKDINGTTLIYSVSEKSINPALTYASPYFVYHKNADASDTGTTAASADDMLIEIYNIQKVSLRVTKTWADTANDCKLVKANIKCINLKLQKKLADDTTWTDCAASEYSFAQSGDVYTFSGLALASGSTGKNYAYRAIETGYTLKDGTTIVPAVKNDTDGLTGTVGAYTYTTGAVVLDSSDKSLYTEAITNTRTPRENISVTKEWHKSSDNKADMSAVTVTCYLNYKESGATVWSKYPKSAGSTEQLSQTCTASTGTSFTGLPKMAADGKIYLYSVTETYSGYSTSYIYSGGTTGTDADDGSATAVKMINTEADSLTVTKKWADTTDYGIRSQIKRIRYTLQMSSKTGSGEWSSWGTASNVAEASRTAILSTTNDTVSFTKLPATDPSGTVYYRYRALEDAYSLYADTASATQAGKTEWVSSSVTDDENGNISGTIGAYSLASTQAVWTLNSGYTQTYTNTLRMRPVYVSKTWDDKTDCDGFRPVKITVALVYPHKPSGTDISVTLDGTSDTARTDGTGFEVSPWEGEWAAVPEFDADGTKLVYTVAETGAYQETGDTVNLIASGATSFTVYNGLTENNVKDSNIYEITYDTETNDGSAADKPFTVTDKLTPASTGFTVTKVWNDSTSIKETDDTGILGSLLSFDWGSLFRPKDKVVLTLEWSRDNGSTWKTAEPSELGYAAIVNPYTMVDSDNWSHTWSGLPKYCVYNSAVIRVLYRVREAQITGYTTSYSSDSKTVTNTMDTTSYTFTKNWAKDNSNAFSTRKNITFKLQYRVKGSEAGWTDIDASKLAPVAAAADSASSQTIKFTNLPRYDASGNELVYHAAEIKVGDNTVTVSKASGYIMTENVADDAVKHTSESTQSGDVITNTLETVSLSGTKTWLDSSNAPGLRPASLSLHIFDTSDSAAGTDITAAVKSKNLIEWNIPASGDTWTYKITGLPKYKSDGITLRTYKVTEDVPANYAQTVPADGAAATGTADPSTGDISGVDFTNTLLLSLTVNKTFIDKTYPVTGNVKSVSVKLFRDQMPHCLYRHGKMLLLLMLHKRVLSFHPVRAVRFIRDFLQVRVQ